MVSASIYHLHHERRMGDEDYKEVLAFRKKPQGMTGTQGIEEILAIMEYPQMYEDVWSLTRNFNELRKANYSRYFDRFCRAVIKEDMLKRQKMSEDQAEEILSKWSLR